MMPDNTLNPAAPTGNFLVPDSYVRAGPLEDYELGSLALEDPTGGLRQRVWQAQCIGNEITLTPEGGSASLVLTTPTDPQEITFCFDSNMRPQIAYQVADNEVAFYWYDTVLGAFTTTTYYDISSPRLALDDKRDLEGAYRDVLFFYLKEGPPVTLCYRLQRERYQVEWTLMTAPEGLLRLGRVGMADTNRMQIEFITRQ